MKCDNVVDRRIIAMVLTEEERQEMVEVSKEFYNALQKKSSMEKLLHNRLEPISIGDLKRVLLEYNECKGAQVRYFNA